MNTKLTLRLNESAIEKGKVFASQNNTSLSQIVESYFLLLDESNDAIDEIPVSKKLQSLVGIGAGTYSEREYRMFIEEKHS